MLEFPFRITRSQRRVSLSWWLYAREGVARCPICLISTWNANKGRLIIEKQNVEFGSEETQSELGSVPRFYRNTNSEVQFWSSRQIISSET